MIKVNEVSLIVKGVVENYISLTVMGKGHCKVQKSRVLWFRQKEIINNIQLNYKKALLVVEKRPSLEQVWFVVYDVYIYSFKEISSNLKWFKISHFFWLSGYAINHWSVWN